MNSFRLTPLLWMMSLVGCAMPFEAAPRMHAIMDVGVDAEGTVTSAGLSLLPGDDEVCPEVSGQPRVNGADLAQTSFGGWVASSFFGLPTRSCQRPAWSSMGGETKVPVAVPRGEVVALTVDASDAVFEFGPLDFSVSMPARARVGEPLVALVSGELPSGVAVEYLGSASLTDAQRAELTLRFAEDGRTLEVTTPAVAGRYRLWHSFSEHLSATRCEGFLSCQVFVSFLVNVEFELEP